MTKLNELTSNPGATKKRKRVGRGIASGKGKTAGKGQKGQKARSGVSLDGFEGGQMPIYRRLPKFGFNSRTKNNYVETNLERLQKAFDDEKLDAKNTIDAKALKEAGVINRVRDGVKILGTGEISTKATFEVAGATKSAIAAIEKAGGKVTLKNSKTRYAGNKEKRDAQQKANREKAAK